MGLKSLNHQYITNQFTKVNNNLFINSNSFGYLLLSALADGYKMMLFDMALATFLFISFKVLF